MHRREFLQAVGLGGATAGVGLSVRPREDAQWFSAPASNRTTGTTPTQSSTQTATQTPDSTPTPTPAVATPSKGFDPLGSVEVRNGSETVVTPDGTTAFVAVGDGFAAVDVSDPARPAVIGLETNVSPPGASTTMAGVRDVKYDDGELLVAGPANRDEGVFQGVALFDVADPTEPRFRRAHATTFPVHNCFLDDGYAYLTGNDGAGNPLVVVDLTDDREVARWSVLDHDDRWADVSAGLRTLHDVYVQDGLAHLAYWDAGTWILDVSDPTEPSYVANISPKSPESLASKSGLDAARAVGQPPGNDHYVQPSDDGTVLGVGTESWDSGFGEEDKGPDYEDTGGPSGVALYDISDPTAPEKRAEIAPPPSADHDYAGVWTTAHNFDLAGEHLYSSWYRGGVRVHDVTDPASPRELAHFRRSRARSFWTAQLVRAGGSFVAMSYENPQDRDLPGQLYTFPDPRTTPTATPAPPHTPTSTVDPTTAGPGPEATGTPTPGPASPGADGDRADGAGATVGDGGPGFGTVAGLTALGVGVWRLLGRGGREE